MTVVRYEPTSPLRDARARYFEANGFGADGGYGSAWVEFKFGPVPFPFPNTASRVRAVKIHDLHHILTAYDTDFLGELEISCWEIGAGCRDFWAAWVLNLGGMSLWWLAPRRFFRAFVRGLRSDALYGKPLEALLDGTVAEARAAMHVPDAGIAPAWRASDLARFVSAALAGVVVGVGFMAVVLPLVPLGYVAGWVAKRSALKTT